MILFAYSSLRHRKVKIMEYSLRNFSNVLEPNRTKRWRRKRKERSSARPSDFTVRSALLNSTRTLCTSNNSLQYRSSVQRFRFNIGGARYEIAKKNLDRYPDTLLGSSRREQFFDAARNEYFLDRDSVLFKGIVEYYRTGDFHICRTECPEETLDELSFYGIPIERVAECCCENIDFEKIPKAEENVEEQSQHQFQSRSNHHSTAREKLWEFLTKEHSSQLATAFSYFFGIVVLLNICAIIAETIPALQEKVNKTTNARCDVVQNITIYWRYGQLYKHAFFGIDSFCVGIFTFEYLARLFSVPKRWEFVVKFSNLVDFVGILPYYINIVEEVVHFNNATLDVVLTALRSLRVIRITKLARHSSRFQNLLRSIKGAAMELGGILFSFMALNIMLSTLTYYVENHPPQEGGTKFANIPVSFWYCIVTMTTLGYGDMVPMSFVGKIIGSICVLTGILLLALPVPIIERKLNEYGSQRKAKGYHVSEEKTPSRPIMNSWPTRPDVSVSSSQML